MSDNLQPINDTSSKVFDELFSRYQNLDTDVLLVYLFDKVNESALAHFAEQFHITGNEGWVNCKTEQEKRDLIKHSIQLHKYRGTKYSLTKVLDVLGLNGVVSEWFEYDGTPYYFRLSVDMNNKGFDATTESQLLDLVEENKNVRSKLDKLTVSLNNSAEIKMTNYMITSEEMTV